MVEKTQDCNVTSLLQYPASPIINNHTIYVLMYALYKIKTRAEEIKMEPDIVISGYG